MMTAVPSELDLGADARRRGLRVWIAPIAQGSATDRRCRERRAVAAVLRHIFGSDTVIAHTAQGAPSLPQHPQLQISISHCRSLCAVALADGPAQIGIDIEEARPQLERVAPRVLSAAEMDIYAPVSDGLLQAWTLKEALYKAALTPGLDFRADIDICDARNTPAVAYAGERPYDVVISRCINLSGADAYLSVVAQPLCIV
ncbi:MAG: 4'-phosphopantetheinyl transferase superfamily protein [Muribaculaceae bacterium]